MQAMQWDDPAFLPRRRPRFGQLARAAAQLGAMRPLSVGAASNRLLRRRSARPCSSRPRTARRLPKPASAMRKRAEMMERQISDVAADTDARRPISAAPSDQRLGRVFGICCRPSPARFSPRPSRLTVDPSRAAVSHQACKRSRRRVHARELLRKSRVGVNTANLRAPCVL